jgi:hypothetical protein
MRAAMAIRPEPVRQFASDDYALPENGAAALRGEGWRFYHFIGAGGARLMCARDTTAEGVRAFAAALAAAAGGGPAPSAGRAE